jgi:hypothetical protein
VLQPVVSMETAAHYDVIAYQDAAHRWIGGGKAHGPARQLQRFLHPLFLRRRKMFDDCSLYQRSLRT